MIIKLNLNLFNTKDTIIMANNRQVLAFKKTWQQQMGRSLLPNIMSWDNYIYHTWISIQINSHLRFICNIEKRYLLSQTIMHLKADTNNNLIDEIVKNYNYYKSHLINIDELANHWSVATKFFNKCIKNYENTKSKFNLADLNDLIDIIINNQDNITINNKPYAYGFQSISPQQKLLLETVGYTPLATSKTAPNNANKVFKTIRDEIFSIAIWAKNISSSNKDKQIAIVCPQLNEFRYQFITIFDEVFNNTLTETGQKSYNISLGITLNQYPLIKHLLLILELSSQIWQDNINTATFNCVVTSPYIKAAKAEKYQRIALTNNILALSLTSFKIKKIKKYLITCPILNNITSSIINYKNTTTNGLAKWLIIFNKLLKIWGFASDRALSSAEYQLLNKYKETSLCLNKITKYSPNSTTNYAIKHLKNWLSQVMFQAKAANTNIQILSILEAQGIQFDYAWVANMTHDFLPIKLNSLVFIPFDICDKYNIPNTNYTHVFEETQKTLTNLYALTTNVIFSYSKNNGQQEINPCTLIKFDSKTISHSYKPVTIEIESLEDFFAPKLVNKNIKKGVLTLKNQMECAFKGFAERLNITEFDQPHIGLNRSEQGNITHLILANIYKQIPSQKELLTYSEKKIATIIKIQIDNALNIYQKSNFIKIERERLIKLLTNFLASEAKRHKFKIIATEQTIKTNIAGLNFNTRLDRIDQIENGDIIIFDYKTGNIASNPWFAEIIKEPQLPIYAITNKTDGIAFIELKENKINYRGIYKNKTLLPQMRQHNPLSWNDQTMSWKNKLNQSSIDFQQGKATVTPVINACKYCNYKPLCRIEN